MNEYLLKAVLIITGVAIVAGILLIILMIMFQNKIHKMDEKEW